MVDMEQYANAMALIGVEGDSRMKPRKPGTPHKGWKAAARKRHEKPRMSEGVDAFVYRAAQNFDGKGYPRGTSCMFEQQFGKTRQAIAALRRGFVKVVGSRYIATVAGLKALGLRK